MVPAQKFIYKDGLFGDGKYAVIVRSNIRAGRFPGKQKRRWRESPERRFGIIMKMENQAGSYDYPTMALLSIIQDLQDQLVERFCSEKRLLTTATPWFEEKEPFHKIEQSCLEKILFFEDRGYYLFREPEIDHQPGAKRLRIEMTFKPTENNR
ncbi:MAG: hypothetical protein P1V20_11245 [Verrucomicrobiales bacterium]|nr:hypothetical protein [Verrucomicrobiales bacterium]